jgi:MoxR-like ATPase
MLRVEDLRELSGVLRDVDLQPVRGMLADLIGELLAQGVTLSDRRIVRAQKLVAAAALLREDGTARPRDFWPLAHLWTEQSDAALLRDAVYERVIDDGGEPATARRSPAELAAIAQHEASLVLGRQGTVARGPVIAALRTINELLTDARTHHPAAHPTHELIRAQRDRVSVLLDQQS